MAGERGLHRDLGRLPVADLAHEDDVWVLAEDRPQAVGERDVGQLVDLALVDVLERVLDRILDRHDVADLLVELVDRCVQARRLAAAGRPGNDDHPVGRMQHAVEPLIRRVGEAQLLQGDQ